MKYNEELEICKKIFKDNTRDNPYTRRELVNKLLELYNKLNSIHKSFKEVELKEHLLTLSKADVVELYLQQRYDQELFKTEILTSIYNQIIDISYFQLNIFDKWDMFISQEKFDKIFSKGVTNDSSNIN